VFYSMNEALMWLRREVKKTCESSSGRTGPLPPSGTRSLSGRVGTPSIGTWRATFSFWERAGQSRSTLSAASTCNGDLSSVLERGSPTRKYNR
jgi:hypothetical protein